MAMLVLAIRFACEVTALAILGWFGARTAGLPLAIVLPLAAGILWGLWIAPRSTRRLPDPWRFAAESIVWAGAIASLVVLDHVPAAAGFGVIALATAVGARRYEPAVHGANKSLRD